MKCPADVVTACDKQPECKCGFCKDHCICATNKREEQEQFHDMECVEGKKIKMNYIGEGLYECPNCGIVLNYA